MSSEFAVAFLLALALWTGEAPRRRRTRPSVSRPTAKAASPPTSLGVADCTLCGRHAPLFRHETDALCRDCLRDSLEAA